MKNPVLAVTLVVALFSQTGCGPAEREPPPQENVFSDQTKVLEEARGVEDTLLEAEEERRKQLEDPDRR